MNGKSFSKVLELLGELKTHANNGKPTIIGIDGSIGSGKTILSYCLGCELKFPVIAVDNFLKRHQGGYRDQINYDNLADFIDSKITSGKSLIIEGICLLQILKRIDRQEDVLVYVKRMSCNNGTWCEEQELNGNGQIVEDNLQPLMNEVIKYHNEWNPLTKADIVFERIEET